MKKLIILPLMLLVFLGCRKEEPVDLADFDNYIYKPATCANGVLDADEAYIDCGPTCGPCVNVQPPCSNTAMKFVLTQSASPLATYNFTNAEITRTLSNGIYEVVIQSGNDKFILKFGGQLFSWSNAEGDSNYYDLYVTSNTKDFYVEYYKNGNMYKSIMSSKCYFNYVDGKYKVDFCNLNLESNINIKGSISFNK